MQRGLLYCPRKGRQGYDKTMFNNTTHHHHGHPNHTPVLV